jgi:hypothetical protein
MTAKMNFNSAGTARVAIKNRANVNTGAAAGTISGSKDCKVAARHLFCYEVSVRKQELLRLIPRTLQARVLPTSLRRDGGVQSST